MPDLPPTIVTPVAEPKKGRGCAMGCLVAVAIVVALVMIAMALLSTARDSFADFLDTTVVHQVQDADDLTPAQKQYLTERLHDLADAVRSK